MFKPRRLSTVLVITLAAALLAPTTSQGTAEGQPPAESTTRAAPTTQYGTATLLLEDLGGGTIIDLAPAYETFVEFYILQEGATYYLWISSTIYPSYGVEQRLQSTDGLVWRHRTDTNLTGPPGAYMRVEGLRTVIKENGIYEGWEQYYYEWSAGWAHAHRYVTSTNGITWTVVDQPALIGSLRADVVKVDGTYHMWATVDVDPAYSSEPRVLRHRTSSSGGTGWGDWQTGGELVTVDGQALVLSQTHVRRLADGTYQLYYHSFQDPQINLATSSDGVHFTTAATIVLNLPAGYTFHELACFNVVDVAGEDWIYFVFRDPEENNYIAVSRPLHFAFLPSVMQNCCVGSTVLDGLSETSH